MATSGSSGSSGSSNGGGKGDERSRQENEETKYTCYTDDQLAAFEEVYAQCPYPSASQRQQMKCDYLALKDIEAKQIKDWFQNCRSRDEQKKDNSDLHLVKERLVAANILLMEENDNLKKKVIELLHENDYLQQSRMMIVKNF